MTTQERHQVQSEIGALKKMLAHLPESSVIDRMSLEARKEILEEELALRGVVPLEVVAGADRDFVR